MAVSLRDRLMRLEQSRGIVFVGGVVACASNEAPQEALARSGRVGGCIVMPMVALDVDEWERETIAQQRRLLTRAAALAATGKDPG